MNSSAFTRPVSQTGAMRRTAGFYRLAKAQSLGAVVGLVGGILAGVLGALLTAAGWFVVNKGVRHWLSTAGTTLLFLTIPLIIFGGYCMDWMEKNKSQRHSKVARYENDEEER